MLLNYIPVSYLFRINKLIFVVNNIKNYQENIHFIHLSALSIQDIKKDVKIDRKLVFSEI